MATTNLKLEKINLTDDIKSSMLEKMNGNFEKIDEAYNFLVGRLLEKTGKTTLSEAVNYVDKLVNAQDGTITSDKVFSGYVGYSGQKRIVGTALAEKTTGSPEYLIQGKTFYDNTGKKVEGSLVINTCYVSSSEPGNSEGNDNDLWLIVGG